MNIPFTYILRLFVAAIVAVSPTYIFAQIVDAVDDIAHTTKNKPVVIDALLNDYGVGALHLDKIVLQNHGTANIENGKIVFVPENDFKGAALLNYTACDAANNCACGLVIIDIAETPLPVYQEMQIFAVENVTTKFTMPIGYVLKQGTAHGSVTADNSTGEWLFNSNFKGNDFCVFELLDSDGTLKTYEVQFEVLNKPNEYVVNDLVSTQIGQTARFNVLSNDKFNAITGISFGTCTGGQITSSTDGSVIFTPNLPEGGKASFTYTVNVPDNKTETATVTIFVSNYLPSKDQFRLTSSGVPLVLHYPSPIEGFRFEPLDEQTDAGGSIKYYTSIDTIIGIQHITGKNILLYIPNPTTLPGTSVDAFYVKHCIDNTCTDPIDVYVDMVEPITGDQCSGDCIWPGDANADGSVNMLDLYPIGFNIGQYGPKRNQDDEGTRNEWYAHGGTNWGKNTFGVDMKYTDTNGDGIISADDAVAIKENYGKNATITPIKTVEESAIEIQMISSVSSLRPSDMVELIVSMGSSETPAYDTKGLSFSLEYDANRIKEESISVDFSAFTWLSRYDAYLPLDKIVERGKLEAGVVRSNGKGANGHGQVGIVRAVVEDDLSGFRGDEKATLKFHFNNAMMMGANGQLIKLKVKDLEIPLVLGKKTDVLKNEDLLMYPNPASDMVNFYINGINKIDYVRIMDAAGREITRLNHVDAKSASVPVSDLQGFYIAEIMTEKGRIVKKLEIFK